MSFTSRFDSMPCKRWSRLRAKRKHENRLIHLPLSNSGWNRNMTARGMYFLVSPTLLMTATVVEAEERDGVHKPVTPNPLIGSYSSSLHRLKDIDNKGKSSRDGTSTRSVANASRADGGFFVFGDMSCKREGTFRLQFTLFELRLRSDTPGVETIPGVNYVSSIVSREFKVVPQKEFRGLMESTHLSRTFSDQGVRLRLRKEPRTLAGAKRSYHEVPERAISPAYHNAYESQHDPRSYAHAVGSMKRQRANSQGPSAFTSPHMQGGPVSSQYGSMVNNASAWPAYSPQSYSSEQYQHQHGLLVQTPTHEVAAPAWTRPSYQQGPYTNPSGSIGALSGVGNHGYSTSGATIATHESSGTHDSIGPHDGVGVQNSIETPVYPTTEANVSNQDYATAASHIGHQAYVTSAPSVGNQDYATSGPHIGHQAYVTSAPHIANQGYATAGAHMGTQGFAGNPSNLTPTTTRPSQDAYFDQRSYAPTYGLQTTSASASEHLNLAVNINNTMSSGTTFGYHGLMEDPAGYWPLPDGKSG